MSTKLRVFQTHQNGDLLLRFVLEADSHDTELMGKFGEPEVEVGGTFFEDATLTPVRNGSGVITSVTVVDGGAQHTYSAQRAVQITAVDPSNAGAGATFAAVLNPTTGVITSVTVLTGGTGYGASTTLSITGGHVTNYAAQKVKLLSGFPYTRRINTIAAGDTSLAALADLYVAQIETNVAAALTSLRALDSSTTDLTKEVVYQP